MRGMRTSRRRGDEKAADRFQVLLVTPATGSTAGGTNITVKGRGFLPSATVRMSGTLCTSITIVDTETITCTTPALGAGLKTCRVTQSDGRLRDRLNAFTYV